MDGSLIISFGSRFRPLMAIEYNEQASIDTCRCLDKHISVTVLCSGVRANEMLWQRNIQDVIFDFVQKDKLALSVVCFLSNVCQPSLHCMCDTCAAVVMYYESGGISMDFFQSALLTFMHTHHLHTNISVFYIV